MMITPIILCGGSGTRLWPMSRANCPKQFIKFNDEGISLFQKTIQRLPEFCSDPILICNESHRFLLAEQLREISKTAKTIILEPEGRNTAPAIAIGALEAMRMDNASSIVVLSADHEIKDITAFHEALEQSIEAIAQNFLVTFGIKPSRPETGYGYIKVVENGKSIKKIFSFKEKPNQALANEYFSSKSYFWNSGMFAMKAESYLSELKKFEPDIYNNCAYAFDNLNRNEDFARLDPEIFVKCKSISIDYAVMERTKHGALIPLNAGWSDLGSWGSLWLESNKDNLDNVIEGDIYTNNVNNSLIYSKDKFTSVIGVENLVIIDTKDALLISNKETSMHTKEVVSFLKKNNRSEHILHKKVHRPWGFFESLEKQDGYQVKLLSINPGAKISLQKHSRRSEHWIIISGVATVTCDNNVKDFLPNQSTFIPNGSIHRLENNCDEKLKVIEVQTGDYLGEDDIIRIKDKYNR